jgi:Domain of unknown function (DUF4189)
MRWSTYPMAVIYVISVVAAITPAHACRMVPQPGGGYKYVCEPSDLGPQGRPGGSGASVKYGAVAYSPSSGRFGYSDKYSSSGPAKKRALEECGQADCDITWFSNGCGAYSASSNGSWGGNWAPDAQRAQALAQAHCAQQGGTDCEIKISHCSGG